MLKWLNFRYPLAVWQPKLGFLTAASALVCTPKGCLSIRLEIHWFPYQADAIENILVISELKVVGQHLPGIARERLPRSMIT